MVDDSTSGAMKTSGAMEPRTFSVVRKGYDRMEVDQFQHEVASELHNLQERHASLAANLNQLGIAHLPDLKTEIDSVGSKISHLLEEAVLAAADIRTRAARDADRRQADAEAEATEIKQGAVAAAMEIQSSATQAVEQAQAEARATITAATEEALFIRAEAEREAIRITSDAKQDFDAIIARARTEATAITDDAIDGAATMQTESAESARVADEEVAEVRIRRDHLLAEVAEIKTVTLELQARAEGYRSALTHATEDPFESSVRVIGGERYRHEVEDSSPPLKEWTDGDSTVRLVVPSSQHEQDIPDLIDGDAIAAEVESLRSHATTQSSTTRATGSEHSTQENAREVNRTSTDEVAGSPAIETTEDGATKPPTESTKPSRIDQATEETASDATGTVPEAAISANPTVHAGEKPHDMATSPPPTVVEPATEYPPPDNTHDISGLFARLREPEKDQLAWSDDGGQTATDAEAPSTTVADAANDPQSAEAATPPKTPPIDTPDPADERDRVLVPLTNEVVRGIKRQIVDVQNTVLEKLRLQESEWRPSNEVFSPVLTDASNLPLESHLAGVAAAGAMAGSTVPNSPVQATSDLSGLIVELQRAVSAALDDHSGDDDRERAAGIGRVFRAWRSDETEQRVRAVARTEYNRGVAFGLRTLGLEAETRPTSKSVDDPDAVVVRMANS